MERLPASTEQMKELTPSPLNTCTPDLFLQGTSQIFDRRGRSGIYLLHPQQMCMYSFMSSLAITHKELVCQCCVCSFCALYSCSNEWCWLDYSVSVRLLGGPTEKLLQGFINLAVRKYMGAIFCTGQGGQLCYHCPLTCTGSSSPDRAVHRTAGWPILSVCVGGVKHRGHNPWHWAFTVCT